MECNEKDDPLDLLCQLLKTECQTQSANYDEPYVGFKALSHGNIWFCISVYLYIEL